MATNPNPTQTLKSQQIQLQKLLAGKQLRYWTSADVILWLQLVNDGLFGKYTDLFESKKINGQTLMTLDNEKTATELLGTQHQINTFVQSIKQLKSKNGRKMSIHRRRQSRRGQSLMALDTQQLFQIESKSVRDLNVTVNRSSTPTHTQSNFKRKYRKRATSSQHEMKFIFNNNKNKNNQIQRSATPTSASTKSFTSTDFTMISPRTPITTAHDMSGHNGYLNRQRSWSQGDVEQDPKDKKSLWKLYKSKQSYAAFLAKRGKLNTSFKKRWFILCEREQKTINYKVKHMRQLSSSFVGGDEYEEKYAQIVKSNTYSLSSKNNMVRNKRKHSRTKCGGYLFYFSARPKDNNTPNGFIDLSTVECVIGLFDANENNENENNNVHNKSVKYLKNKKGKESDYYEIVVKTKDREWIFGALDTSSYVEWLIRLKRFEHK